MDSPLVSMSSPSYSTGSVTPSGTKKNTAKKAKGILQAPLGYFNLGVGIKLAGGGNLGGLSRRHPAYNTVKSDYENNPDKYWQGVVGLPTPDLHYETDSPTGFSYWQSGFEVFIDLGQLRLGREFSSSQSDAVMMKYVRDTWGQDVTTAAEFIVRLEAKNIFTLGLNLLKDNAGEMHRSWGIALWLNYGFDRYEYEVQNRVYREIDIPGGSNSSQLIDIERFDSGTGFGHRLSLEYEAIPLLYGSEGNLAAWLPLSMFLGFNFGRLTSSSDNWSANFYQLTGGFRFGLQCDFLSD